MPKVTQLPFISTGTTATSFLVIDELATRRIRYTDFVDRVVDQVGGSLFAGPTGPAGPAGPTGPAGVSDTPGPTGPSGPGIPDGGTTGQVLAKQSDSNYDTYWTTVTSGSGGSGMATRSTATNSTNSLSVGASEDINITGFKTYMLYKVETSSPAWVRIYADSDSRSNDASRTQTQDPIPGSGVIAEVITVDGSLTQLITPGVVGFNNDPSPTTTLYLSVTNNDITSRVVDVTLTLLQLEA